MDFKPNLMTTGIGSIPFSTADESAAFVIDSGISIPFWPQVPALGFREQMIPQYADGMPCVKLDNELERVVLDSSDKYEELERFYEKFLQEDPELFPLSEDSAGGFYAFKRIAADRRWPIVKGHITGAVTIATGIKDAKDNLLYADTELLDAIAAKLVRNAEWQVSKLKTNAEQAVLIFIDEPVLSAYGSTGLLGVSEADVARLEGQVIEAVRKAGGLTGIHVCGNSDWGVIIRSGVDVVNFDAYEFGETIALYPDDVGSLLERSGCIAWGIVPTSDAIENETVDSLSERFDNCVNSLVDKGFDRGLVLERSLLTPSCGTGSLSTEMARKVFHMLVSLQSRLAGS